MLTNDFYRFDLVDFSDELNFMHQIDALVNFYDFCQFLPFSSTLSNFAVFVNFLRFLSILSIFRLGEGWEDPMHRDILKETVDLTPKEEKPVETEAKASGDAEKSGSDTTEKSESADKPSENSEENSDPVPKSSPSNEELAKMWQPKTRQSIAQRLKGKYLFTFLKFSLHLSIFHEYLS